MTDETAFDVVNRQTGEVVGTAYMRDGELVRFEPKEQPKPAPDLYRIVWWQSLIEGMAQGETLEENVAPDELDVRVLHWRISLRGAIGAMVGSCPMSFVPEGDKRTDGDERE